MATQPLPADQPVSIQRRIIVAITVLLAVALLGALVVLKAQKTAPGAGQAGNPTAGQAKPALPLPKVEPLVLDTSDPDTARKLNAEIPFSSLPNPAAPPFRFIGDATARERATDCLAAAMLYEAGDTPNGERAVGQVVLNRLRHPAFPKTVCAVVFQGEERATGCQFTFTCDGAMARQPNPAAWERARMLASVMLAGDVYKPVGMSTHYHTDWVMPYWSASLEKVTAVDTHLFFRWTGWWGTPPAFLRSVSIAAEPVIRKLALLSLAHRGGDDAVALVASSLSLIDDNKTPLAIGPEMIGKRFGPGKLLAIEPGGEAFLMAVDKGGNPARYAEAAERLCAGRAQCRLMAWTDPAAAPSSFPLPEASRANMSFSYIRRKESGLERVLYNCDEFPAMPKIQCMVRTAAVADAAKPLADRQAEQSQLRIADGAKPAADAKAGQLKLDPPAGKAPGAPETP